MITIERASEQLPHLIRLLEDETPVVRQAVMDALTAFGPDLKTMLSSLEEPPSAAQWQLLEDLMSAHLGGLSESVEFVLGQVVHHKRYGYRGVVVAITETFSGDENWYQHNQTQPDRDQPWYHVLVHGSGQVTYAAQSSLEEDLTGDQVSHPYVPFFFSEFQDGTYIRNDQPWPE